MNDLLKLVGRHSSQKQAHQSFVPNADCVDKRNPIRSKMTWWPYHDCTDFEQEIHIVSHCKISSKSPFGNSVSHNFEHEFDIWSHVRYRSNQYEK